MYTYKPQLIEDDTGIQWAVLVFRDGDRVGSGSASCEGTQAEQEAAIEAEAQRIMASAEEDILKQAKLEQKKAAAAVIIQAIETKFSNEKEVPAVEAEKVTEAISIVEAKPEEKT